MATEIRSGCKVAACLRDGEKLVVGPLSIVRENRMTLTVRTPGVEVRVMIGQALTGVAARTDGRAYPNVQSAAPADLEEADLPLALLGQGDTARTINPDD